LHQADLLAGYGRPKKAQSDDLDVVPHAVSLYTKNYQQASYHYEENDPIGFIDPGGRLPDEVNNSASIAALLVQPVGVYFGIRSLIGRKSGL